MPIKANPAPIAKVSANNLNRVLTKCVSNNDKVPLRNQSKGGLKTRIETIHHWLTVCKFNPQILMVGVTNIPPSGSAFINAL